MKKRRGKSSSDSKLEKFNITDQEAGNTAGNKNTLSLGRSRPIENGEDVDPPFPKVKFGFLDFLKLLENYKGTIAIIISILGFVWLVATQYSRIDNNVTTLNGDMVDVKKRTEVLERDTIRSNERIGYLERTGQNMKFEENAAPNKKK